MGFLYFWRLHLPLPSRRDYFISEKKNTYATAINFIFRKAENVYDGNIDSVSWRILMLGLTMFDNVTESRCISYFPFNSASTQHGLSSFFFFHEWNTTDTL